MSSQTAILFQKNNFESSLLSSLKGLKESGEFHDVTLISQEGKDISAHKIVLAAGSPVLRSMMKKLRNMIPMVYLNGVSFGQLCAIRDFLYLGEATINEEMVPGFLEVSNNLNIEGLSDISENDDLNQDRKADIVNEQPNIVDNFTSDADLNHDRQVNTVNEDSSIGDNITSEADFNQERWFDTVNDISSFAGKYTRGPDAKLDAELLEKKATIVNPSWPVSGNFDSFLIKGSIGWKCTLCGKESGNKVNLRNHVRTNHSDEFPCDKCGKILDSRESLRRHKRDACKQAKKVYYF